MRLSQPSYLRSQLSKSFSFYLFLLCLLCLTQEQSSALRFFNQRSLHSGGRVHCDVRAGESGASPSKHLAGEYMTTSSIPLRRWRKRSLKRSSSRFIFRCHLSQLSTRVVFRFHLYVFLTLLRQTALSIPLLELAVEDRLQLLFLRNRKKISSTEWCRSTSATSSSTHPLDLARTISKSLVDELEVFLSVGAVSPSITCICTPSLTLFPLNFV